VRDQETRRASRRRGDEKNQDERIGKGKKRGQGRRKERNIIVRKRTEARKAERKIGKEGGGFEEAG
jgi:hypothetical protein